VKRLCLLGMAMAGLLSAGITTAATAKTPTKGSKPAKVKLVPKPKPVTTKVSCKLTLVLQPTAKVTTILPGTGSGSQVGTAKCPGPVGGGVQTDNFTTDDSGDVTAPYTQWFKGGTLAGQYTLIPSGGGQPSAGNNQFGAQSYTGTLTVTGGSGGWKGATGKAKLTCATPDAVHLACTESLTVTVPPATK
jgi:hypothetical protein